MKILKEPEVPEVWKIKKKCTGKSEYDAGCKAVLEVEETDIYLTYEEKKVRGEFFGDSYYYDYTYQHFTFKCPCCGKEIRLEETEIPFKVRERILNSDRVKRNYKNYKKRLAYKKKKYS